VRYWSKSAIFLIPPCIPCPSKGGRSRSIGIKFGTQKLEWFGYPVVKKV